ncbi:MAG: efflux RND transporter periplasmic adaptor subunit [Flavobacteriales bacterium]|nr:MAG: efflux RND transporter periplasmic adaptor subunit [Flavobacteriales bacterium]
MKRIAFIFSLLALAACSTPAPEAATAEHAHDHAHADEVVLDSAQQATLGITTIRPERRSMEGTVKLTGRVTTSPVSKAQLTSPIGAKVVAVLVDEGAHVRKGQPLVALSDMAFIKMQEEYVAVSAQAERADAELRRQRTLLAGEATAQKQLEQAEADFKVMQARRESLGHQLTTLGVDLKKLIASGLEDRFTLRSPIDGRVNGIRIFLDARVEPTTVLLEVIDLHHFHVHLNAYERDLALLTEGVLFDFQVLNMPGKRFKGELFSIGRTFDADGRSIPVHAHVEEGSEQLIEGMSVVAFVPTGAAEQLVVPDAALQRSGDKGFLFLLMEREPGRTVFQRIEVVPGVSRDGYAAVSPLEPLPQHAEFAADKVYYLWSMLENEGGHEH